MFLDYIYFFHWFVKLLQYKLLDLSCTFDLRLYISVAELNKDPNCETFGFTHEHMVSKKYFPTKARKGQRWGSGVKEAWSQCRRRPQVYTSVKRVHSVWLHGQGFTKVHCVGPVLPQHTVTHMHTPPQCTMPTQDTDNGGFLVCLVHLSFCWQLYQNVSTKSFFFSPIFHHNLYFCGFFPNLTWCFTVQKSSYEGIERQKHCGNSWNDAWNKWLQTNFIRIRESK